MGQRVGENSMKRRSFAGLISTEIYKIYSVEISTHSCLAEISKDQFEITLLLLRNQRVACILRFSRSSKIKSRSVDLGVDLWGVAEINSEIRVFCLEPRRHLAPCRSANDPAGSGLL